jgi:hypothetical protein
MDDALKADEAVTQRLVNKETASFSSGLTKIKQD